MTFSFSNNILHHRVSNSEVYTESLNGGSVL